MKPENQLGIVVLAFFLFGGAGAWMVGYYSEIGPGSLIGLNMLAVSCIALGYAIARWRPRA